MGLMLVPPVDAFDQLRCLLDEIRRPCMVALGTLDGISPDLVWRARALAGEHGLDTVVVLVGRAGRETRLEERWSLLERTGAQHGLLVPSDLRSPIELEVFAGAVAAAPCVRGVCLEPVALDGSGAPD